MKPLYADNRIYVCLKPPGVVSTDEAGGLPALIRKELGDEHACVRTVHRLDQVVGGVMVLARSRRAAQLLSEQVRRRTFEKEYLAVVHGTPSPAAGTMRDLLVRCRATRTTLVTAAPGKDVREGVLDYETLETVNGLSLVKITLHTGRTHQIRAQFSARKLPLVGDVKYGAPAQDMEGIALWSHRLSFCHPQSGERLTFTAQPPEQWPWNQFNALHAAGCNRALAD